MEVFWTLQRTIFYVWVQSCAVRARRALAEIDWFAFCVPCLPFVLPRRLWFLSRLSGYVILTPVNNTQPYKIPTRLSFNRKGFIKSSNRKQLMSILWERTNVLWWILFTLIVFFKWHLLGIYNRVYGLFCLARKPSSSHVPVARYSKMSERFSKLLFLNCLHFSLFLQFTWTIVYSVWLEHKVDQSSHSPACC